jgi:hypothetical protein
MHIDLDTLIDHAEFNDTLREMIVAAGRA